MRKTYIISAFPGCGKTVATRMFGDQIDIIDSDSSSFPKDKFPKNYIDEIENRIGTCDVLFISSHKHVRDELDKRKIRYTLYYPSENRRNEFLENYVKRRSKPELIKKIDENFNAWIREIDDMESDYCQRIKLGEIEQFIGNEQHFRNLIERIVSERTEK